jgi:hypothetical protein
MDTNGHERGSASFADCGDREKVGGAGKEMKLTVSRVRDQVTADGGTVNKSTATVIRPQLVQVYTPSSAVSF